jgi:predicted DNA-binding protein (MmcQ/YjbR family)
MIPGFSRRATVWHHGWVSLHANGALDWEEIEELVKSSYALVAKSGKQPRK